MAFNRIHLIRQVDLFTLKLYLSAVEEGQIGRAAIRENISASTATKRIQDLEEIADIKLLERTPSGVVPTPAGRVLERYLRSIFGQLDDLRTEIMAFSEGMRGEIALASVRSIIAPFLADELGEFGRNWPEVEFIVHELDNGRVVPAVVSGEAEIGVFAAAPGIDLSEVDVVPYREDRLLVVLPLGHPLARRESVTFADLLPERLIPISGMVPAFETAAAKLKQEFRPKFVVRTGGVALSLVKARLGVAIQPECLLPRGVEEEVAVVTLDEHWAKRQIMIATPRGRTLGRGASTLVQQLLDRAKEPAADLAKLPEPA